MSKSNYVISLSFRLLWQKLRTKRFWIRASFTTYIKTEEKKFKGCKRESGRKDLICWKERLEGLLGAEESVFYVVLKQISFIHFKGRQPNV